MERNCCVVLCLLLMNQVSCQNDTLVVASKPDAETSAVTVEPSTVGPKITSGPQVKNLSGSKLTSESWVHSSIASTLISGPGFKTTSEPSIEYPFGSTKAFPKQQLIFDNTTLSSERQLLDFRGEHPKPIGLLTIGSGLAVDVRDTITFNSDLLRSDYFFDLQSNADGQKVPERIVHPKGTAAWGYFEVTNDVSNYTHADVFNDIGKKTTVLGRLSVGVSEKGGSDVGRDLKGFAMKFFTKEGNLDFLNLQTPVFAFKDPIDFEPFVQVVSRNPKTNLPDPTALLDLLSLRPQSLPFVLYLTSDRGIPDGWRHADFFPVHAYELNNKHGERYYVRFNWRTERGLRNLTLLQIFATQAITSDYYIRDLYNAIANKNFPSWRLEMDVLTIQEIQEVDYNPIDVTRLWKKGTYKTVTVGRLVLDRISDNHFRDQEQAAFDPTNLVPGIPGPIDTIFRGRRFAYRDAQNYRVSHNFHKVGVNEPQYAKNYNRDGYPPIRDNGNDSPFYYPNSYNGPLPLVDDIRPKERLQVLESNAADLQEAADFYEEFAPDEASKDRMALNNASILQLVTEPVRTRFFKLFYLINPDLYRRTLAALAIFQTILAAAQAGQTASANT